MKKPDQNETISNRINKAMERYQKEVHINLRLKTFREVMTIISLLIIVSVLMLIFIHKASQYFLTEPLTYLEWLVELGQNLLMNILSSLIMLIFAYFVIDKYVARREKVRNIFEDIENDYVAMTIDVLRKLGDEGVELSEDFAKNIEKAKTEEELRNALNSLLTKAKTVMMARIENSAPK